MKISAEKNKKGADYYIKEGFIPTNIKKESVSCLLEFAYDDWCIAQMAKALGHMDDYETFIKRSQNFINVFDGSTVLPGQTAGWELGDTFRSIRHRTFLYGGYGLAISFLYPA